MYLSCMGMIRPGLQEGDGHPGNYRDEPLSIWISDAYVYIHWMCVNKVEDLFVKNWNINSCVFEGIYMELYYLEDHFRLLCKCARDKCVWWKRRNRQERTDS